MMQLVAQMKTCKEARQKNQVQLNIGCSKQSLDCLLHPIIIFAALGELYFLLCKKCYKQALCCANVIQFQFPKKLGIEATRVIKL